MSDLMPEEHLFDSLSSWSIFQLGNVSPSTLFFLFKIFVVIVLGPLPFCIILRLCVLSQSLQSCLTLCNRMDYNLPGSSVHGILQAKILEWVAVLPPGDPPNPGIEPRSLMSLALAAGFLTTSTTWEAQF